MSARTLLATTAAAVLVVGCGGSDDNGSGGGDGGSSAEPSPERVEALVRSTPGANAECGELERIEQDPPPGGEEKFPGFKGAAWLCNNSTVLARWGEFGSTADVEGEIRRNQLHEYGQPYFVNGKVLIETFAFSFPGTELERSLPKLPERIKQDCSCGEVRVPPRRSPPGTRE